ncbi:unnamed protein product, partial [Ectocarpus sp. 8 AP-2014]
DPQPFLSPRPTTRPPSPLLSPEHDGCLGQTRLLGSRRNTRRRFWGTVRGTVQGTLRIDDGGSGRRGHVLRLPGVAASVEEKSKRRPRGRQLAVVGRGVENVPAVLGVLREPVQQPHGRFAGPGFGSTVRSSRQGRRRRSSARAAGVVRCVSCGRQIRLSSDNDGGKSSSGRTAAKPRSLQRNLLERCRRRPKRSQWHREHRQQQRTRPRRSNHRQLRQ